MNSSNKYFLDCICEKIINNNQVILSNKVNGRWVKIPIECYEVLKYSVDNALQLGNLYDVFQENEDKKYYERVIDKLEHIGLLSDSILSEFRLERINKISFSPTNRCNLSCDYCCVDSKIDNNDYLDTSQVRKVIDNIVKLNPRILTITGGEPLMRNDFLELLDYIKEKFKGKIILSTNATLIKEKQIDDIINGLYAIEISLDGYDELSCSEVRGKGVFCKVLNVIRLIKLKKFENVGLSMVVGKNNEKDIEKFNKLNEDLGTTPIIRNFMNIGRGNENYSKYLNDKLDIDYICKDDYVDESSLCSNMCKAGVNQISIDHKGDVYPCPNLEYKDLKIFNILEFNENILERILNREMDIFNIFDKLKPVNIESCKECKVNLFCTTCPSKIYTLKNNKKMFDANCKKIKNILEPILW